MKNQTAIESMKRAAISAPSTIAEGQARQHLRESLHFLSIAKGSLAELDSQRIVGERLGFISPEHSRHLDSSILEIRKMLYSLCLKLKDSD